ncbi:MAG TPA: DUF929 family protein [Acidimicrobiales bacterium]
MAKSSRAKNRPAPSKGPARGGRPAGLFTWLAVGLVVVVVAGLVIIKVASGGAAGGGSTSFQPTDPTTFNELTKVPASVFNTVGVTSTAVGVSAPQAVKSQPILTEKSSTGTTVPEVLYIGAEYCPYCAAQRWSTIIALSRFGTWSGLGNMTSSAIDQYPNTPTFTFVKATFKSKYVAFTGVEEQKNYVDPATSNYATLQTPTAAEAALVKKYDTPKYIKGLTASQGNPIPFMTFANKFLVAGASYSPTTLTGSSRSAIASGLSNAASPITAAIIASANYQTAAICSVTKQQPSAVCTSPGVKAADKVMGIK